MNDRERRERASRADRIAAGLAADGVRAVALTWVDNAGLTRVKGVPTAVFGRAAAWGSAPPRRSTSSSSTTP